MVKNTFAFRLSSVGFQFFSASIYNVAIMYFWGVTPTFLAWADRLLGGAPKQGRSHKRSTVFVGRWTQFSCIELEAHSGYLGRHVHLVVEKIRLQLRKGVAAGGKGLGVSTYFRKKSGLSTLRRCEQRHQRSEEGESLCFPAWLSVGITLGML